MQTVAAAASQHSLLVGPWRQQHSQRTVSVAPFRSTASTASNRRQAAPPAAQQSVASAAAAATGGWQRRRPAAPRRVVLAASAPREFDKDKFEAANKDYARLTQQIEDAAAEVAEGLQGTSLFLIGMMGSGKSTVGKLVAQALGYCFFDTDSLIEQLASKRVADIFAEEGEGSFREVETQVLAELSPFKNCVVATGGGVPTRAENWGHMQGGITVWLNGSPQLLAHRVVGDGTEQRPLLSQGEEAAAAAAEHDGAYAAAVARLTALLEERRALYADADIAVPLEGSGPAADLGAPAVEVCHRVLAAIAQRIKDDAAERARRMEFEIVREDLPPTMRVMESPAAAAQRTAEEEDPFLP